MLLIGSHVSYTKDKGLLGSVEEALSYGSNTFMIYTGAPQNTNRSPINDLLTSEAHEVMKKNGIDINNVIVHAPYIINLANPGSDNFGANFLKQEISRCNELGLKYLVLHPGSYVRLTEVEGIKNIINGLNIALSDDKDVYICLETMAGKGTELGTNFNQMKQILDGVKNKKRIKLCLDTCHLSDAGYDINDFDKVLDEIENIFGNNIIGCIHINDSINVKGAHKDRHANIGFGTLGFNNIVNVIYNERLKNVPKILETPYVTLNDNSKERLYPPYKFEIEMIKNKKFDSNLIKNIREYYKNF